MLAILEARDRASEVFAKVDESLGKFSETAKGAADSATAAGDKIDESLLKTASGADALDVATARVQAAQERATRTADEQAQAETALLDVHKAAATAADDDAASQYRLMDANAKLTATTRANAAAQKDLAAAQKVAAAADTEAVAAAKLQSDAQKKAADSSAASAAALGKVGKVAGITALGMGIAGALMVKAAGNFQDSTTHLVTDAGESAANLKMVQAGILQVSTATGQSAEAITQAMYHVESSGFHAATGLAVLKTVAQGARVGNADLDSTSKALMGTLTAYYGTSLTAAQATKYSTGLMNQLIATTGSGDLRMQDLAGSLHSVTAQAAAAHVPFAQVGAAIATMTAQGMTANQATLDLGHVIGSLQNPTNVMSNEMRALGLNANSVSKNLGKTGLAGTMNEMRDAVLRNTSGGYVMLGYLKLMTPAAQGLSNQIMAGTITTGQLTTAMKTLNPEQAALVTRFKAAAVSATGLKQTYSAAMSKMTGGQMGLNVALMLTGKHMGDLTSSTSKIADAGKKASGNVAGWSMIQGTFNFKLAQAKTAVENTGIAIGSALLPAATALLGMIVKVITPVVEWTSKHKTLTLILFGGVTALAATVAMIALATKAFKAVTGAVDSVKAAVKGGQTALQKLGLISKETADTQKKAASDAAATQEAKAEESAAAQESSSAEAAAAQETDAAEVATANEVAATESSGSWVAAAATSVGGWVKAGAGMIGNAAKWAAQSIAKVAVVVAQNVAGAAVAAAAWIAANAVMLLGIGLVIAAVVVAVVEIVKHWKQITAEVARVWHDVLAVTSAVISAVISFIKAHWALIVGIFLGPIALVVALVVQHWKLIERYFQDGVRAVERALSWFITLPQKFRAWIGDAASAVASEGTKIIRWFESLPGKVLAEVEKIPAMLFSSGEHIIESLANGITSAAGGALHGAMSFVGNTIKSFLPFSPAKQGPLSGSGDPSNSGRSIVAKVATGITSGIPAAAAAAAKMAGAVHAATSGLTAGGGTAGIGSSLAASAIGSAGGGGAGSINLTVNVTGNTIMGDADTRKFAQVVGKQVVKEIEAAGRHVNLR